MKVFSKFSILESNSFMRKLQVLLFVFVALHSLCFAQRARRIDSLLTVLKTQTEDTNRVNTLNNLARNYQLKGDYSLAVQYAKEAIATAEKLNFIPGNILGHTHLGHGYLSLNDHEQSLKSYQAALKLSEQTKSKRGLAMSYNNVGNAYFYLVNADSAVKYFEIAAKMWEAIGDKLMAATSYYNLGNAYYSPLSNYVEAIKTHTLSLQLSKAINDKNQVAARYIDIGNCYESLGNYPESLKNYLSALKIAEEIGDKDFIASASNNIGEIYNNTGDLDKALGYYLSSFKVYKEINNNYGISICYDNIGMIYQKKGNLAEALKYHLDALKLGKEINWIYGMAYTYFNIGDVYFIQPNYADALNNYFTSLKLFKQCGEDEGQAKVSSAIGKTYFKMQNFTESRKYLNEALTTAKEFQGKKIVAEAYEILAKIDSTAGDWQKAYEDQKLFTLHRDSLLSEESSKKIIESVMQYQFEKKEDSIKYKQALTDEKLKQQHLITSQQKQSLLFKENEVSLLNSEKQLQQLELQNNEKELAVQRAEAEKKQNQLSLLNKEKDIQSLQIKKQKQVKTYLLAGLVLFCILSFFVYWNYRTRQQLKLQTLRNKIASDLHDDVGSTLSSISIFSQMAQEQSKEVIPLLETIQESSHKMLDAMADIVWTIKPENDQFEKIILRMKSFAYELLGAKNIDFEFIAEDEVSKMKLPMEVRKNLYLIFKEATNNMVKYAQANKAMFAIRGEKNNLVMMIKDNGKGFDINKSSEGNGLKNMKRRANEIGADLVIDSHPGNGTTIQLRIAV